MARSPFRPGTPVPLDFVLLALLGAAVGAFGTIVGAGGGFILVPILLLIYPDRDPRTLTAMSLFVVMANSMSGTVAYARQRRIDWRSGATFSLATLPGAVAGALLVEHIPRRLFDAIFALVLGGVGVFLLVRNQSQAIRDPVSGRGIVFRRIRDRKGDTFVYNFKLWQGILLSGGIGFVSSLLGIGGGVVQVPMMVEILHFPVHIATATSQFVVGVMALEGVSVHLITGNLGWDQALGEAGAIALGSIGGAQAGARIARRLRSDVIVRLLAGSLLLVALRLGLLAAGV